MTDLQKYRETLFPADDARQTILELCDEIEKMEKHRINLELHYIGACSLLGNLTRILNKSIYPEDLELIDMALNDLVKLLPGRFTVHNNDIGVLTLETK